MDAQVGSVGHQRSSVAESSNELGEDSRVAKDGSEDVIAQGLAAVLGPVVREFDARVEGALKSQSLLTGSIDRLTKGMVSENGWPKEEFCLDEAVLLSVCQVGLLGERNGIRYIFRFSLTCILLVLYFIFIFFQS